MVLLALCGLLFCTACSRVDRQQVDELNSCSYASHYRDLQVTLSLAQEAYRQADGYGDGKAEALNNIAFVYIMRMDYTGADSILNMVYGLTNNEIELAIADVQHMRRCQRQSLNKEFYDFSERAAARFKRIDEERDNLSPRMERRLVYAETEYAIVSSTYYYYIGLDRQSVSSLQAINPTGTILNDTAQYLNYLYNVGSGGIIRAGSDEETCLRELDYLHNCLHLARESGMVFFEANAMASIAEHQSWMKTILADSEPLTFGQIGAQVSLAIELFRKYGDIYQTAGAYRSLATVQMYAGDFLEALESLDSALVDIRINQAPDLVASIHEQLCIAYSAINDKPMSDYNRNIYLDLQERTRQDKSLEARAERYDRVSSQLSMILIAVVVSILVLLFLLWLFHHLHQKSRNHYSVEQLMRPLAEWREQNDGYLKTLREQQDVVAEEKVLVEANIRREEERALAGRAKLSLVMSVLPLIDRMLNEVERLYRDNRDERRRQERISYIRELSATIQTYNDVLTNWIQLRQGQLLLHISSFPLQPLFDIVSHARTAFDIKGVSLCVRPTESVVKADRVLTLFMINTLVDNARKFTPQGGQVEVWASECDAYVELSVSDTGVGFNPDILQRNQMSVMNGEIQGHGFGLMNCKGIIEKYRKTSRLFAECCLDVECLEGKGSRFFFRLPKGRLRTVIMGIMLGGVFSAQGSVSDHLAMKAKAFADSAYFSNIDGAYGKTMAYVDSCISCLNMQYSAIRSHDRNRTFMVRMGDRTSTAAEIQWFRDSVDVDYLTILDVRNECAVAALALHDWNLYAYNNAIYTQLFKESSADNTLSAYCRTMQLTQANKTVAIIILFLVLLSILPAYYFLYYRHRLHYRFCLEKVKDINDILVSDLPVATRLHHIRQVAMERFPEVFDSHIRTVCASLEESERQNRRQSESLELMQDELNQLKQEEDVLHVANAVLDNSLSSLKHETMYYPGRIQNLLECRGDELQTTIRYYRELYTLFTRQAQRQTASHRIHLRQVCVCELLPQLETRLSLLCHRSLVSILFRILREQCLSGEPEIAVGTCTDGYVRFLVRAHRFRAFNAQIFSVPHVDHIPYMLCRQIVRDHSEASNRRGCGILAVEDGEWQQIEIILPQSKEEIHESI